MKIIHKNKRSTSYSELFSSSGCKWDNVSGFQYGVEEAVKLIEEHYRWKQLAREIQRIINGATIEW